MEKNNQTKMNTDLMERYRQEEEALRKAKASLTLKDYALLADYIEDRIATAKKLMGRGQEEPAKNCYENTIRDIHNFEERTIEERKFHYTPLIQIIRDRLEEGFKGII